MDCCKAHCIILGMVQKGIAYIDPDLSGDGVSILRVFAHLKKTVKADLHKSYIFRDSQDQC